MNFIISVFAFIGAFFTAIIVVREFKLWLMRRKAKKMLEALKDDEALKRFREQINKDGDSSIEEEEI